MSKVQRTAVITGATSERGIGIDVAHRYAREGWAVVVLDLDGEKSAKVAADIGNQFGVPAFGYAVDVTSEESVAAAHEAVAEEVAAGHLPPVGALANIAGITSPVPFLDTTLELWNKVMAVNATGTYLVTKAFLPDMIDNGWGRIVNMSSVSAQRGGGVFGKVPYSSAKAADPRIHQGAGPRDRRQRRHRQRRHPRRRRHQHPRRLHRRARSQTRQRHPDRPGGDHRGGRRRHHLPVQRRRQLPHRHHHRHQRRQPHPLSPLDRWCVVEDP